jgi:outer membrane protein assembly factor BamE (lipoprotein component of BamABCDE complex)
MKQLVFLLSALLVTGCVSSGTKVDAAKAAQFKPGITTEADVTKALGPPDDFYLTPDGGKVNVYKHISASPNAATFIPYVGLFAGKTHTDVEQVQFMFSPDGKLKTSGQSQTHGEAGMFVDPDKSSTK